MEEEGCEEIDCDGAWRHLSVTLRESRSSSRVYEGDKIWLDVEQDLHVDTKLIPLRNKWGTCAEGIEGIRNTNTAITDSLIDSQLASLSGKHATVQKLCLPLDQPFPCQPYAAQCRKPGPCSWLPKTYARYGTLSHAV